LQEIKALNDLALVYLKDLVTAYEPARTLRSENAMLVVQPKVRTQAYGERRFDKAASTLWNSLPSSIRHEQFFGRKKLIKYDINAIEKIPIINAQTVKNQ
jgi:hypothetical protein